MSIFSRFSKQEPARQPITKVSMRYVSSDEEVHEELCKLAWQMTIGNAKYADACDVLQLGKAFPIPRDDGYSQLDVRDFRVYGEDHYLPDDEEGTPSIVLTKGKLLGCIYDGKKGITDLDDRDDAHEFIERLEQVYKMWSDVEAGKQLPDEEPKQSKNSKKKANLNKEDPDEGKPKQKNETATDDEDQGENTSTGFPNCLLRDLYAELTDEELLVKFQNEPRSVRNKIFTEMKAEYDRAVEYFQAFLQEFLDELASYATTIDELNGGTASPARRFLNELEAEAQEDQETQEEQQTDSQEKANDQSKLTEEDKQKKVKNYIRRQKTKVKEWTQKAEKADDEELLDLLDDMEICLTKGDVDRYKELRADYERLAPADQQTNSNQNSSKNGGKGKGSNNNNGDSGKKSGKGSPDNKRGNQPKPDGNQPSGQPDGKDGASDDEDGSDTSAGNPDGATSGDHKDESQQQKSGPARRTRVTIAHVFEYLEFFGIDERPKMLKGEVTNLEQKVSLDYINQWLKDLGYDEQIPEE